MEIGNNEHLSRFQTMAYDAIGLKFGMHYNQEVDQSPNAYATKFYDLLYAAQDVLITLHCLLLLDY